MTWVLGAREREVNTKEEGGGREGKEGEEKGVAE